MTAAFLAGIFSPELCDIRLYDELYSGPLEDPKILAFPDMLVLTGLNTAFDRMLHTAAYAKTMNEKVIVVAGGPAIRAVPQYASNYFDYCCTGDIEELSQVIEDAFGMDHVSESFLEKKRPMPRFDLAYWTKTVHYVESSRNCYFRCKFCSLTAENGKYQAYELSYLRSQFEALGKKKLVHFLDNNFSSFNKKFLLERFALLKELRENEYFEKWAAEVTSDFFLQNENLDMAFDSGCMALFSGIESFDHKTLLDFGKTQNMRIPQEEMILKCLNAGIAFLYGIVLDYSSRTIAELREELDVIIENSAITLPSFITLAIPLLRSPFFMNA